MKLNLDKQYIYDGKRYGPGQMDLPDDVAKSIKERMEAMNPNVQPTAQLDSTATGGQHESDAVKAKAAKESKK